MSNSVRFASSPSPRRLDHWGSHRGPDGLLWLLQPGSSVNAWGLPDPCPFEVRPGVSCPHDLNLATPAPPASELPTDLVFRFVAGAPAPAAPIRLEQSAARKIALRLLLRLWGGKVECVQPIDLMSRTKLATLLHQTNLAPLVLTGCTVRFFELARLAYEIADAAPRRLILMGDRHLPLADLVEWNPEPEDLATIPWEAHGAALLRTR